MVLYLAVSLICSRISLQLEVFEFEIEMHLMLLWGHFFKFNCLLVQLADAAAVGWCSHCAEVQLQPVLAKNLTSRTRPK